MKGVKLRCHTVDYVDSNATRKEQIKVGLKRLRYDGNKIMAMMNIYTTETEWQPEQLHDRI